MVIGVSRVPLGRLSSEGVAVGQTLDDSEPAFAGSRELYEAVVRAIGDGIVVRSALGECLFANEQAARLLGFAAVDDVTGSSSRAVAERLARVDRATAVEVHDDEDGELRYVVTFLGAGGIGEAAASFSTGRRSARRRCSTPSTRARRSGSGSGTATCATSASTTRWRASTSGPRRHTWGGRSRRSCRSSQR
jgi:PAS domain-containing protein